VGLERGPLSLVSTTEELLDRKVAVGSRAQTMEFSSVFMYKQSTSSNALAEDKIKRVGSRDHDINPSVS
jgi:hypothetical protein